MIPNPFQANRNKPQQICWKHFIDKSEYHVELILPWDCIINEVRDGAYMSLCAIGKEISDLHISNIEEDKLFIMDIPVQTWNSAWLCVNRTFREQFNSVHNLRVRFLKQSKQAIKILDLERLNPTEEQKTFANDYYRSIPEHALTIKPKKRREQL